MRRAAAVRQAEARARPLGRRLLKFMERLGQGWLWFGGPIAALLLSDNAALRRDAATLLAAMLLDLATVATLKVGRCACCDASRIRECAADAPRCVRAAGVRAPAAAAVQRAGHAHHLRRQVLLPQRCGMQQALRAHGGVRA
jgi:hypothetical protein